MILSFNGRANIGIRMAQEKFPEAQLLEVHGIAAGPVSDPNAFVQIDIVLWHGGTDHIVIRSTGFAEFDEPELMEDPYDGSIIIKWPIEMELAEAQQLKEAAGFTDPYTRVTLRHMMHPGMHPCFIFNCKPNGFVFVDTVTKKVSQGTPPMDEA